MFILLLFSDLANFFIIKQKKWFNSDLTIFKQGMESIQPLPLWV